MGWCLILCLWSGLPGLTVVVLLLRYSVGCTVELSPPVILFPDRSKTVLLLWIFLLFMFHVCLCDAVLSVLSSRVITCWERTDSSALLCCVLCVIVTFSYAVVLDCIDTWPRGYKTLFHFRLKIKRDD